MVTIRHRRSRATCMLLLVVLSVASLLLPHLSIVVVVSAYSTSNTPSASSSSSQSSSPSSQTSFRIVSWNILAQLYAKRKKYPWTKPEHLEWNYRQSKIVESLLGHRQPQQPPPPKQQQQQRGTSSSEEEEQQQQQTTSVEHSPISISSLPLPLPDIICLQEVQIEHWENGLKQQFEQEQEGLGGCGYNTVSQNVTRGHPVANAVLVRKDFAKVIAVESRSRALIVVLDLNIVNEDDNDVDEEEDRRRHRPLFLVNVHLDAGMDTSSDEVRFCQIKSLLKRTNKYVNEYYNNNGQNEEQQAPIIIVGDFNMRRDNPLYDLLHTGKFPRKLCNNKKLSLPRPLPFLPLRDAYQIKQPTVGPVHTTYTGGAVLDYLWTTNSLRIEETWRSHPDASVLPLLPEWMHTSMRYASWPNAEHPSDHLPIGATLTIN